MPHNRPDGHRRCRIRHPLPPSLKDQPGFAWLGYTGYADQREEFGKVAGLPGQPCEIRNTLATVAPRAWLYADHHGERLMLARTKAPEPGARAA
jgi:hypothetical protein